MAQKSLSVLHRIDNSMTWDMRIFNKQSKWASYSLWIVYTYFYKTVFFIQTDKEYSYKYLHTTMQTFIFKNNNKIIHPINLKKRFSYYIALYSFEFLNYIILLSIFFQINLNTLSKKRKYWKKKQLTTHSFF